MEFGLPCIEINGGVDADLVAFDLLVHGNADKSRRRNLYIVHVPVLRSARFSRKDFMNSGGSPLSSESRNACTLTSTPAESGQLAPLVQQRFLSAQYSCWKTTNAPFEAFDWR
ncbi:hypothetical protein FCJ61_05655 [Burkholderia metallica]|uniref:hypothetical protein n=1 Tax=Burkholderia metallica TaxID=488729 RepID=UPI00157A7EEC|nr:hypothetical protein [Burkholderia metallica]NTZ82501.1 hypothetical protein [Burkholderia metallica]